MVYESEQWLGLFKEEKCCVVYVCEQWYQDFVVCGIGCVGIGLYLFFFLCLVCEKNGSCFVIDGFFVEMKEIFGGFEFVECVDWVVVIVIVKMFFVFCVGFMMEVCLIMIDDDFECMIDV